MFRRLLPSGTGREDEATRSEEEWTRGGSRAGHVRGCCGCGHVESFEAVGLGGKGWEVGGEIGGAPGLHRQVR